jgi:hypothetical protein
VITDGVEPSLHVEYKSSHVKQYFKEQRALRTETTINMIRTQISRVARSTQPFTVLIDPRIAEDGVTSADLKGQLAHYMRMQQMVTTVNQIASRVRDAQAKLRNASGADAEKAKQIDAITAKPLTEPVRYGMLKKELDSHRRGGGVRAARRPDPAAGLYQENFTPRRATRGASTEIGYW